MYNEWTVSVSTIKVDSGGTSLFGDVCKQRVKKYQYVYALTNLSQTMFFLSGVLSFYSQSMNAVLAMREGKLSISKGKSRII